MTDFPHDLDFTIHDRLIIVGMGAENRQQVIAALSERLLFGGYVKPSYAEAALAREKLYPTGLPTAEPIALPHADVAHCLKPALAVALLTHPVTFNMMGDPAQTVSVRTVLALSVVDAQRQVQVLGRLIKYCQSADNILALHTAGAPVDVAARLRRDLLGFEGESMTTENTPAAAGASVILTVAHGVGLHARPAAKFVQAAAKFQSDITIKKVGGTAPPVNAKSILKVLTLAVKQSEQIEVHASGVDAEDAIKALRELVESNFGE